MARYSEKQKAALDALMRDDVYTHAMKIIETEGLGSLTMEGIAAAVGVSRGTLYNYFDDKDDVVDFLEDRTFDPVLEAIEEVASSDLDAETKLTRVAKWVFKAIYEDRALVVALSPTKYVGDCRARKLERMDKALRAIESIIRDGVSDGTLKQLEPEIVSQVFSGTVSGMIERMALTGEFQRADEIVPTFMEIFLGGLRTAD